jgi:transcriptional regulatory protein RtcR
MAYRRRVHAGVRLNVLVTPLWQARPGRERCFRYDQCSAAVSPETTVRLNEIEFGDPGDFEHVYETLFKFARTYSFEADAEDYLIHITTGTHVAQICLFLLTESRYLPGRLLQASPERDRAAPGEIKIIDLDLSKYDRIASRFREEQSDAVSYLKGGIETRNSAFNELIDRIEQVAIATRDPLLLMEPTGAGKSKLARRIFELKKLRHTVTGEFVDVNCATLRGDAAMYAVWPCKRRFYRSPAG